MNKSGVRLGDFIKFWKSVFLGTFIKYLRFKFKGYLNFFKSFFILNKLFLLLLIKSGLRLLYFKYFYKIKFL